MYNMNKPTTKPKLSITPNTPAAGAASLLPVAGPAAIAPVAIAGGGVRWVRGALMRCFTSAAVLLVLAFSATGASAQSVTINPQGSGGANVRTFDAGGSLTLTAASISGLSSPFTYAWQHPNAAGTPAGVTFSRRDQSTFTITASPSVATVTFGVRLEVSGSTSAGPAINSASITIRNNNQSPTAAVGPNQTVNEGTRVTLLGSGNDPDGNNADLNYLWTQTGGPDVTLSNATVAQPTFTVPDIPPSASAPTLFIFTLRVRDVAYPATNQSTATARIFIRPLFQETIDNQSYPAGNEIMELPLPTALTVTGGTNTYTLSSVPPGLSLNNRTLSGTPTGTMRTQTFNLTYTATGSGGTDTLSFSITVTNAEATGAPTISGDPVETQTLTATANTTIINDANGFEVVSEGVPPEFTYQWNRRNGTTDTPISGETSATYTLTTADIGEQITVTASFTDGGGRQESRTSIATAAVRAANEPPVASAGSNQTVNEGATVTLDGSGTSDPDAGDTLTYLWEQTSGTTVTLNDTSAISPTFTAPVRQTADDGELAFTLTVTDSENETSTATVTISVTNLPPVADAGEAQTVDEGEEVTLDGSGSSGLPGDGRTYLWTQTSGTTVTLNDATAISPTFTAPIRQTADDGEFEFTLTLTDAAGGTSTAATVTISVTNLPPTADAGEDQTVDEGEEVTLDGSGSSGLDGDGRTYAWTQTSGTTVTLNDATAISPTFTAPIRQTADDGEFEFTLTLTDAAGGTSTAATVTISVTNLPPTADAGEDQTVDEGEEVTLDGSGSSGLDGDGRTYAWTQTDGTTVTLNDATAISPTFTAPNRLDENADLEFMLTVTDLGGASDTDSVQIGVATDAPVRQQALKTGLAALGRGLAASATDAIGQRLKPAATRPETSAFSGLSLSNCIARAAQGAGESPWAGPDGNSDRSSPCALPSTEQLARSAFVISLNGLNGLNGKGNAGAGGGYWSLWGRGDLSRFEGRPQAGLDLDGDLTAGYLGLDYRLSSGGLVGVALSRSEGEIDYRSGTTDGALDNGTFDEGTLDTSLNSVYPYGYWSPRAGLGLWGLLGVGSGDATLTHRETDFATDLDMRMGALGLRQAVQTLGSFDLALKADAFVVELESENVPGLPAVSAQARRARLLLEASHSWQPYPDERLGTSLELGLRADGGDADEGAGAELGVGLEYSNSRLGLRAQWRAQGLLAHSASGFEEWGTSLNVEFDPGVSGQGLALTLAPTWGQAASGGAQALWQSDRPLRDTGLAPASAMRMDLDLSYGLNRDRRQLSPFASLGLADGVMQRLRLGLRLGLGLADELEMELFGGRNASENRSPEHLLGLTGRLRF